MKKLFGIVLVVSVFAVVFAFTAAADSGNRFKNSAPNPLASNDDGLFTPEQFEAAMAARPDPSGKIFVSRCRFAPFSTSTTLYAPFAGTQTADAIVGDTTFPLANGTKCYNPQNESNIVINPTNANNVVTSANEYRAGRHFVLCGPELQLPKGQHRQRCGRERLARRRNDVGRSQHGSLHRPESDF